MMNYNKTAIVTGGANGIGKAIVKELYKEGYTIILVDKQEEDGLRFSREIDAAGNKVIFKKCDVGKYDDVKALFSVIKEEFDKIDVLVNNAGVSKFKDFWEMEASDWEEVISTNLSSVFFLSKEAAPLMREYGGSIVNMASTRATMSEANTEAYSASKGGIISITHALAITLSDYNIRVNSISPGWIETDDYEALREVDHSQHPSNRVGRPEDVARACIFLCHEENHFINGENLVIDGGMTRKMIYEH
jgi:NAD(P)-dependent dehydrogenase (short-subunit alcohol dehydrogenase family)